MKNSAEIYGISFKVIPCYPTDQICSKCYFKQDKGKHRCPRNFKEDGSFESLKCITNYKGYFVESVKEVLKKL